MGTKSHDRPSRIQQGDSPAAAPGTQRRLLAPKSRVLVVLDATRSNTATLNYAIKLAQIHELSLVGLGVVEDVVAEWLHPGSPFPPSLFLPPWRDSENTEEKLLVSTLQYASERCLRAEVPFVPVLSRGAPDLRVVREAERCDLILMGRDVFSHTLSSSGSTGSAAARIIRSAPRPIISVPDVLPEGDGVVFAYDGGREASRAIQAFVWFFGSGLEVVHLVSVGGNEQDSEERSAPAADFLRNHGILGLVHPLTVSGPVEDTLLRILPQVNAGLLVMGAYGQSRIRELLKGSVTRAMLNRSPVPLFLYR